jgi:K+-transporting ATPase ATPase A chain
MATNSEQQHYAGEVHLSYGSQLFVVLWTYFVSPAPGLAALAAVIRGLRGDAHLGNFYVDVWRTIAFIFLPFSLAVAIPLAAAGVPMTMDGAAGVQTLAGGAQSIARGPVAAIEAIKQLATAGGGYFGTNSCHPYENPSAWTNALELLLVLLLPFAQVLAFGRMLGQKRHAVVLFVVMLAVLLTSLCWCVYFDAACPNPALLSNEKVGLPALPVDQSRWGNLEGKELRFGPGAGPAWAALTTCTANGSNNCMHDSLNPLAILGLLSGIWLNCNFGAVGSGMLTMLMYVILAAFIAGLMIGRTPEYLGRKLGPREMKLAMCALLVHPILILAPAGAAAGQGWDAGSANPPGPHAFTEIIYEFSSASSNNGSGLEGLADTYGFADNPDPPAHAVHWDIACGIVVTLGRFLPIIFMLALAGGMPTKLPHPAGPGTLPTDSITFGVALLGTMLLAGLLLFFPAAALGPLVEQLGPTVSAN